MSNIWKFLKDIFKKNFIAGTLVLLPIIATIWALKAITVWADSFIISILPLRFQPQTLYGQALPGLGLVVTILLIILTGIVTRQYFGKKIVQFGDKVISKIPIGRSIYSILKEFLTGILTHDKDKFKGVAFIEWPRKGCFMIGFITGEARYPLCGDDIKRRLNIFIPTTPNPTSGFFCVIPEDEVKILDISIDRAFKIIISGGLVTGNNV